MAVKLYDLKSSVLTVGGILVSGYGEDDAVSFDWSSELVESFETVDGTRVYARTQNRELVATITLMQTSDAVAQLRTALDFQHGGVSGIKPPAIIPQPLWFYASDNGDFVSGGAVFLNRPNTSRGNTVGELVFRLSIPTPQWQIGGLDLGVL
jgi:hypothetical protein